MCCHNKKQGEASGGMSCVSYCLSGGTSLVSAGLGDPYVFLAPLFLTRLGVQVDNLAGMFSVRDVPEIQFFYSIGDVGMGDRSDLSPLHKMVKSSSPQPTYMGMTLWRKFESNNT